MLLVTTDEVVDKSTEMEEGTDTQVEMVTLAMVVKTMEKKTLNIFESRTITMKSREEK